jgi:hypothetical protein
VCPTAAQCSLLAVPSLVVKLNLRNSSKYSGRNLFDLLCRFSVNELEKVEVKHNVEVALVEAKEKGGLIGWNTIAELAVGSTKRMDMNDKVVHALINNSNAL